MHHRASGDKKGAGKQVEDVNTEILGTGGGVQREWVLSRWTGNPIP